MSHSIYSKDVLDLARYIKQHQKWSLGPLLASILRDSVHKPSIHILEHLRCIKSYHTDGQGTNCVAIDYILNELVMESFREIEYVNQSSMP